MNFWISASPIQGDAGAARIQASFIHQAQAQPEKPRSWLMIAIGAVILLIFVCILGSALLYALGVFNRF